MTSLWSVVLPLVQKPPDSEVTPGWIGGAMFIALAVATVLLWLSFRRQLKKVRFEEEPLPPRRTRSARETPTTAPSTPTISNNDA